MKIRVISLFIATPLSNMAPLNHCSTMFSFFKQKPKATAEVTFKTKVTQFWDWYGQVAPRFYETIEAKKCPSLAPEVSAKVNELFPFFAWEFGPGEGGIGHAFTLSGEGDAHRQLLTQFWLSQAPTLSGWTFYASRQPMYIRGHLLKMDELDFDPIQFWLTPVVDREEEKVDITVWHPLFDQMQEKQRWTVLFLFLDQVMGEYGTGQWIGEINLNNARLAESMPLHELNDFVKNLAMETGWKKYPPGEVWSVYSFEQPQNRFVRDDIVTGCTSHLKLLNDYLKAQGNLSDPLAGTGADYVFIAFAADSFPKGEESTTRGKLEDALGEPLKAAASGRLLGGAHGLQSGYIDLLLLDGRNSLDLVQKIIRDAAMPGHPSINFFAQEKRGWRIVI